MLLSLQEQGFVSSKSKGIAFSLAKPYKQHLMTIRNVCDTWHLEPYICWLDCKETRATDTKENSDVHGMYHEKKTQEAVCASFEFFFVCLFQTSQHLTSSAPLSYKHNRGPSRG